MVPRERWNKCKACLFQEKIKHRQTCLRVVRGKHLQRESLKAHLIFISIHFFSERLIVKFIELIISLD